MQQISGNISESTEKLEELAEINPNNSKKRVSRPGGLQKFIRWEREEQLQAFFSWLPKELHDAPGIDWSQLPTEVMGYCIRCISNSPDACSLALAAASMNKAIDINSQRTILENVKKLLENFRAGGYIQSLGDLRQEQIWFNWAANQKMTEGKRHHVTSYAIITDVHFPSYLLRLDSRDRVRMRQYALPPIPVGLLKRYFPYKQMKAGQQERRKAQTDILVPLYPVLRQLIRFRKQLAQRILLTIRSAQQRVEAGEVILPYHFEHPDAIPEINRDAMTISEVQIQAREVTMKWVLWDKVTWVQHHSELYHETIVERATQGGRSYTQEENCFFVQYIGKPEDFLWFGDLAEHNVFQRFNKKNGYLEGYLDRWDYARKQGFSDGCYSDRPGLLTTGDRWFTIATSRSNEFLIEFESLYRGILYGAALGLLALSNGSRVSELLQVSSNKERRITRIETIKLIGKDGQPQIGEDGRPLTKQVKLYFQHLLPKGAKTEEERQLFPLSKEVLRLLGEITELLKEMYGEIPTVAPAYRNKKREHLKPEQYLFQWGALPDRETGALNDRDVTNLLRFVLHGLEFTTAQGEPIKISTHVLRHVMATHARHFRHVPPEAIAYFFLHHRLKELTGYEPSLTDISEYYTLMTEEQRFAIISEDLDEQEEMDHALLQAAPEPRNLEQMNEDLRIIFEIWHALHPTAFGYCGCPGLCPRGNDRALCLGCSYLVTDPENLGAALSWRESYAKQAELLEAQGNTIDARQARIKVQLLDDVINIMHLQLQAEADGSYIPLYRVLPSPNHKDEEEDETEN